MAKRRSVKSVCDAVGGGYVLYVKLPQGKLRPISAPAGYTPDVLSYSSEGEAHRAGRRFMLRYPKKKFVVHDCRKGTSDPVYP